MSSLDIILPSLQSAQMEKSFHAELSSEIAESLGMEAGNSFTPFECKQILWSMMARRGIEIPFEIFENLQPTDSLEMWAVESEPEPAFRFILAIGDILARSGYTLKQLATIPWNELFHRKPIYFQQSFEGVMRAVESDVTQFNITDWHTVSEVLAPDKRSYEVKISQISPYRSRSGERGVFGIVRSRPLPQHASVSSDATVIKVPLTVVGSKPPSFQS